MKKIAPIKQHMNANNTISTLSRVVTLQLPQKPSLDSLGFVAILGRQTAGVLLLGLACIHAMQIMIGSQEGN